MRRRLGSGLAVTLVALIVLSVGLAARSAPARTAASETITVSNTNPEPVVSRTILDPTHRYRIDARGTVSDWCSATSCPPGDPSKTAQANVGVDPLYCYAAWRCASPELWRQLQVNGRGLDELAGKPGAVRYDPAHRYVVTVAGARGALRLVAADAVGSSSNNSGAFTVVIADLGVAKTRWNARAYANNVKIVAPLVGKWQLGKFHMHGAGSVNGDGTAAGTITEVDSLTFPPHTAFVNMKVLAGTVSTTGAATTVTLTVQITNADHPRGLCPVGLKGTVVLFDNSAKLSNGHDSDGFTETWSGNCGHVHGANNTDPGPRTSPPTGGPPGGGQWVVVTTK